MSNESLTISFVPENAYSNSNIVGSKYIRLEQVLPEPDYATKGEVAELLESLFEIDPCTDVVVAEAQPLTLETLQATLSKSTAFTMPDCLTDSGGNWSTQVKVILSETDVALTASKYKVNLVNGVIVRTVISTETIREELTVENESGVTLQYPILYEYDNGVLTEKIIVWNGSVVDKDGGRVPPPITVSLTGVLSWDGDVTGSISAEYVTRYYLIDVIVYGTLLGALGECTAVGFWDSMIDSLELEQPEIEDNEEGGLYSLYCPDGLDPAAVAGGSTSVEFTKSEPLPWWYVIDTKYYCACSGEYSHTVKSNVPTQADRDEGKYRFYKTKTVNGDYVDCGETDKVNEEEFYIDTCCEPPSGTNFKEDPVYVLPRCEEVMRKNGGGQPFEDEAEYRRTYDNVRFIGITPEDGDCGTITYKQDINSLACCDEVVEDLAWDEDNSIDLIPSGSSGDVVVTGGLLPLTWTLHSENSYLDAAKTKKKIITSSRSQTIYSDPSCCGVIAISVTDGCSEITRELRAEDGEWAHREQVWELSDPAGVEEMCDSYGFRDSLAIGGTNFSYSSGYGISGRWKLTEVYLVRKAYADVTWGSPCRQDPPNEEGCCALFDGWDLNDYTCMYFSASAHTPLTGTPYPWQCVGRPDNWVITPHSPWEETKSGFTTYSLSIYEWIC